MRRIRRLNLVALLCGLLAIVVGHGQQPAQNGTLRFQSSTQLVVETVSVTDKNGRPIEGLTAKDFTITEDGVPQTISFCEFQKVGETAHAAPSPPADASADTSKAAAVTATQIQPERPGDIRYRDR